MGRRRKEDQLYTKRRSDGRNYFYWRAIWVDSEGRKRTKRVATGIVDDGTPEARRNAVIVGHRRQFPLAAGGESVARNSPTLKQAIAKLLKDKALSGRSAATLQIITEKAGYLFNFFGPNRKLDEISADDVDEYAHDASAKRAVGSWYRELLTLSQAFKATRTERPAFPELPELPDGRDRVLEVDEQIALMTEMPDRWRLHVLFMLQLGIRRSEMWKLGRIDWAARTIIVHGTKTKGARNRLVPIPPTLFAALLPLRETWAGLPPWPAADDHLKRAAKRARIAPLSCNDLRRTYATFMARSGAVDPLQLARYMGTSVKMLSEVYARLEKPGDHHARAVSVGVPALPVVGAQSVLENTAPSAERAPESSEENGGSNEIIDVFCEESPSVH